MTNPWKVYDAARRAYETNDSETAEILAKKLIADYPQSNVADAAQDILNALDSRRRGEEVDPDSPEAASAEEIINALSPKPEQEAVEPIEKTTAQKARKGCGVIAIVLIFVVVFGGFDALMGNLLRAFFGLFVCLLTLGIMCS